MTWMSDDKRWQRVRLGDVMVRHNEIIYPGDRAKGEAVFVGLEHIEANSGRRMGSLTLKLGELTGRKPTFKKGQIVYGYLRPYLNKVWIAEFDGCSSVDQFAFEVRSERADSSFIAAYLRSEVFLRRASVVTTTGQLPRISIDEILATEVDLPPRAEQQRIAGILKDQLAAVERARAAAQDQLDAANTLPAAYLRKIFSPDVMMGWARVALGEISDIVSGITLGRKLKNGEPTRRVPYLRVANVKDGHLSLGDVYDVEATETETKALRLFPGDILLTEGGDRDKLGRGTFWQDELPLCIHQNHIFRVRLDRDRYLPEFISAEIGSRYGKAYFLAHAKQTTGIATINQKVLRGFPVLAPPIEEQRRIAEELRDYRANAAHVAAVVRSQFQAIEALPPALLRAAFLGQL